MKVKHFSKFEIIFREKDDNKISKKNEYARIIVFLKILNKFMCILRASQGHLEVKIHLLIELIKVIFGKFTYKNY